MAGGGVGGGATLGISIVARDEASKAIHDVHESAHGLGEKFHELGGIVAGFTMGNMISQLGGGLEGAIEGSVEKMTELGSETRALSRITGESAEATSSLLSVFEKFGVGAKEAGTSLGIFEKHMSGAGDATELLGDGLEVATHKASPFTDALGKLGVEFVDATGQARPMSDVLTDAQEKFRAMPDSLEKSALGLSLFGKDINDSTKFIQSFAKEADTISSEGPKIKGFSATMLQLGVEFKDAAGKVLPMSEILEKVADKFHTMPDGAEKTATAMALFGRAGKDMIPVLNLGGEGMKEMQDEAKKLGLSLSGENLDQIKKYSMAQKEMGEAVGGLQLQLGLLLLPALLAVSTAIASGAMEINQVGVPALKFFSDNIEHNSTVLTGLAVVLTPVVLALGAQAAATVAATVATIPAIAETAAWTAGQWLLNAALTANPIGIVVVAIAALVAGLVVAYKTSDTFRATVDGAFSAVSGFVQTLVDDFNILLGVVTKVYAFMTTPIQLPNLGQVASSLHLPGFAAGGTVPGAIGAPMLAVVHGGETVTPAGQSGGHTINVNFYGNVGDADAARQGAQSGVTAALQAVGAR